MWFISKCKTEATVSTVMKLLHQPLTIFKIYLLTV